jgi:hypothetical protein
VLASLTPALATSIHYINNGLGKNEVGVNNLPLKQWVFWYGSGQEVFSAQQ